MAALHLDGPGVDGRRCVHVPAPLSAPLRGSHDAAQGQGSGTGKPLGLAPGALEICVSGRNWHASGPIGARSVPVAGIGELGGELLRRRPHRGAPQQLREARGGRGAAWAGVGWRESGAVPIGSLSPVAGLWPAPDHFASPVRSRPSTDVRVSPRRPILRAQRGDRTANRSSAPPAAAVRSARVRSQRTSHGDESDRRRKGGHDPGVGRRQPRRPRHRRQGRALRVVQVKTTERDGYTAVQVTYGRKNPRS